MAEFSTPGNYSEEPFALSPAVQPGETAVPAFVGEFGDALPAVSAVHSWQDVTTLLGGGDGKERSGLLAVLRGYFENGGGRLYLANIAGSGLEEVLAALEGQGDVTMLVAPGLWDQGADRASAWARALAGWAASHQAMAILHADRDHTPAQASDWATGLTLGPHTALYYPWVVPAKDGDGQAVPPVGAVAGTWVRIDAERGVWKAPANTPLHGLSLTKAVTDGEAAPCPSVNFLRTFRGADVLVWGARTLARPEDDQWRYIPVRRLCNAVERDIAAALRFTAFEPNTQPTWERARATIDAYLHDLWREGALLGNKPEEAYFVRVGKGITMSQDDIDEHRMIVKTGLAGVRPAEFIILEHTATTAS